MLGQASISSGAVSPGKERLRLPGSRCSGSPLTRSPGMRRIRIRLQPVASRRSRSASSAISARGDRRGAAEPDAERRRQGARAQAALLPAAVDQRQQPHPRPAPDIERADALRPVDLVAGDRQQVDLHRLDIERDLAEGLRRIGVEQHAAGAAQRADLGERLDDADLVMRRHDRDQQRALVERRGERGRARRGRSARPADR